MARVLHCSEQEYHADPCATPSLSYSTAAELINMSPRSAHYYHPRLGGHRKKQTAGMKLGSLADALMLGGEHRIVEFAIDAWRTKADKAERDRLLVDRMLPAKSQELADARALVGPLRELMADFGIALDGQFQVAIEWQEDSQLGPVLCRCKLDHFAERDGMAYIDDLKAVSDARPSKVHRQAIAFGYDIQASAYTRAVEAWRPDLAGRVVFRDLYCHVGEPLDVVPVRATGELLEFGTRRWLRAVERWARCLHTGKWPGMVDRIIPGEVPAYCLQQEEQASLDDEDEEFE